MPKRRKLPAVARRDRIRELLNGQQAVSIANLAETFGLSEMTIRRDLDQLERRGQVRRTHGGAVPAERMVFEFDFVARRQAFRAAKQAIAHEASKLVRSGQRIILDTGTTTLELAHVLRDIDELTVITPSLAVASELQFSRGVQTVLLGGLIRRGSPDLTGSITEAVLDMFAADIAFQGADGIGLDGSLYNADMGLARVDRKMRQQAERMYILADSSKIGKTALVRQSLLQDVDGLITDNGIAPGHRRAFKRLGVDVIVVRTAG